ncbi:MAG: glycine zipper 2TM domain-containing protein [Alphaproteobacteria bacterium]
MRRTVMMTAGVAFALAMAGPAFAREPSGYYDSHHHWHSYKKVAQKERCERARQNASNKGAVIGGVSGAVLGSVVAGHGAKTEGAAIGGVAGVLTGRQVAKKDHRC